MRIVVRFRRAHTVLGRYLGISAGAHCLALIVLVVVPYLRPKPDLIPFDASPVELVAMAPPASGSVASAPPSRPPEPQPIPEPEGAHAIEKLPPPAPKKEPKPPEIKKPVEIKKKEEPPAPPSPEPPNPGPPGTGTPGHAGPAGVATGPAGITALESGDPGISWYNASITGALQNAWTKPVLEGIGGVQSVIVTFEIGRDGNAFNVAIDVPSGIASLDRSALRAVQDAAPFPPPPPSAPGSSVRQRIRFDLRPDTN